MFRAILSSSSSSSSTSPFSPLFPSKLSPPSFLSPHLPPKRDHRRQHVSYCSICLRANPPPTHTPSQSEPKSEEPPPPSPPKQREKKVHILASISTFLPFSPFLPSPRACVGDLKATRADKKKCTNMRSFASLSPSPTHPPPCAPNKRPPPRKSSVLMLPPQGKEKRLVRALTR